MKKFLAMLLLAAMMFALCACGNQPTTEAEDTAPVETTTETTAENTEYPAEVVELFAKWEEAWKEWEPFLNEFEAWIKDDYKVAVTNYKQKDPSNADFEAEYERVMEESATWLEKYNKFSEVFVHPDLDVDLDFRIEITNKYSEYLDRWSEVFNSMQEVDNIASGMGE
ncbi:MAG: hypothetical protein IJC88_01485 [Oscillospiraceae bacterium]|nr:hypothetical protein [Oscillospiraceae bacterium]